MKKKNQTTKLDELLNRIQSGEQPELNEKEQELLHAAFMIDGQREKVYNALYYRYEKPDYIPMSPTARSWLLPFWNIEENDNKVSLCGFVDEDKGSMSEELQQACLQQYLGELYASFKPFKPGTAPLEWRFYGPLWLLEKYRMTDSLNMVLEALRQDMFFYMAYIADHEYYLSAVIYQLGQDKLDVLGQFLYEDGLVPDGKHVVFDAIVMTALYKPQQRLTAIHVLSEYLKYCLDICKQGANPMNIEYYALSLASAHFLSFMPQLEELYLEVPVPPFIFENGILEIKEIMKNKGIPFHIEYDSLDGFLRELKNEQGVNPYWMMPYGDFDLDEDEEDFDEDLDDDDDFFDFDDDLIYNIDDKAKRLTLRIELTDSPEPVFRDLQVPSNMYLFGFAELIALAFGWKDFDSDYEFVEGNGIRYLSDEEDYALSDEFWEIDSPYYTTIDEVLNKKNKGIRYVVKKGKKALWSHVITLQKSGKYGPNNEFQIALLDARGTYPLKSMKSMAEYTERMKNGKLRQPNFSTVRKNIREFEEDNKPVF